MIRALLASLLLLPGLLLAEEETAAPAEGDASPAPTEARPALPERSVGEAQALEQRLDKREQQRLQAGDQSFLALWLPANVGEPSGAVILLPGDGESADDAQAIGPLRRKLPEGGWHSLSLSLPDPDNVAPPLRQAQSASEKPQAADAADEAETAETAPVTAPAPQADDETRRSAHAQRVLTRIEAGIAFARERQAPSIVLLGHGSGAYWAARYLAERQPSEIHNLLLVAAELPAGFTPPLDELVPPLELATGDFYYRDRPGEHQAALERLRASKRIQHPAYIQVAMEALPGNRAVEQEQLYRRLRGWLKSNLRATASGG